MFCTQCGANIADDEKFCPNCGLVQSGGGPASASPTDVLAQTDGRAVASLVFGILALFFSIFAGIPAVVLGHTSRSQIKKSPGLVAGENLALAGITLGYFSFILFPIILFIAIPRLMGTKGDANETDAAATVHTLITSEATYSMTYPTAGYAPDLATLGPGGQSCQSEQGTPKNACLIDSELGCPKGSSGTWCVRGEYKYSIVGIRNGAIATDYIITATPVGTAGRKNYCSTSESIPRIRNGPPLSEPIKSVKECEKWEAL